MPAKKTTKKKAVEQQKTSSNQIEVLPADTSADPTRHEIALAKATAIMASKSGTANGTITEQRAQHASAWSGLMSDDMQTRSQILELKAKENEVLMAIRDKVAGNLMETLDVAVEEGILEAPDEV